MTKWDLSLGCNGISIYVHQMTLYITLTERQKPHNHFNRSGKIGKNQYAFVMTILNKLDADRICFSTIKAI